MQPSAPPPDQFGGQDPWASSSSGSRWVQVPQPATLNINANTGNPWSNYSPSGAQYSYAQVPTTPPQAQPTFHTGDGLSDIESDTVSTLGDPDSTDPELQLFSASQVDAHLFGQYQRHNAH